MTLKQLANAYIPGCSYNSSVKFQNGSTGQIMQVVMDCYNAKHDQLKQFAPYLKGPTVLQTCSNIWNFVKQNIAYKIDPPGEQWIKEPARVWADKVCDCKSYSVFIASCLHHCNIDFSFRFVSFEADKIPTHVYVVVPYRNIKIDCVIDRFNTEKPFTYKYDYAMTRISQLSGTKKNNEKKHVASAIKLMRLHEAKQNKGFISRERDDLYKKALQQFAPGETVSGILQFVTAAGSATPEGQVASAAFTVAPDLARLFTSAGVTPDFFNKFSFLSFLDNSTGQWKSRSASMKSWTPAQRIAWYIDRITRSPQVHDAIQYHELYGNLIRFHPGDGVDDNGKVPYLLAQKWNEIVKQFIGPDNIVRDGNTPFPPSDIIIDLRRCPDYGAPQPVTVNPGVPYSSGTITPAATQTTTPGYNYLPNTPASTDGLINDFTTDYNPGGNKTMLLVGGAVAAYLLLK